MLRRISTSSVTDSLFIPQDIFSYNVEQSRGDTHNLVAVIMNHYGIGLQKAINYAGKLCIQCMDKFERDRQQLPSWGNEVDREVETYVRGMQDWMVGSLHWSFITKRYFGEQGKAIKKHRVVSLLPRKKKD